MPSAVEERACRKRCCVFYCVPTVASCVARNSEDASEADVLIYNTCSIREKAEQKVYSALGKQVRTRGLVLGRGWGWGWGWDWG